MEKGKIESQGELMDGNKAVTTNETSLATMDMVAFIEAEEARIRNDIAAIEKRKRAEKDRKIKCILTGIVVFLSAVLASSYAVGSQYSREKERKYKEAQMLQEREMYEDAIWIYDKLYGYKDSDKLIAECKIGLESRQKKSAYESALKLYQDKDFLEAAVLFAKANGYEDSREKMAECYYEYGKACVEKDEYAAAYEAFEKAGNYKDAKELLTQYSFAGVEVGTTLTLGSYEQDGDSANGAEAVEWLVLHKEGSKVLLMSQYALAEMPFNALETEEAVKEESEDVSEEASEEEAGEAPEEVTEEVSEETTEESDATSAQMTYADSTIRTFLNETFYNEVFSAEEKQMIHSMQIVEEDSEGNEIASSDNNVFLLTSEMAEQYLTKKSIRIALGTKAIRPDASYSKTKMVWWTSTIDQASGGKANTVLTSGNVAKTALNEMCGVRPAIWIDFVE